MAYITLQYSGMNGGNVTTVKANSVSIGGKKNNTVKPYSGITDEAAEVNTESSENLKITVSGVNIVSGSGVNLDFGDVIQMYTHKYDGTNPIKLVVGYQSSGEEVLLRGVETTGYINVVLESFNISFDATKVRDARIPILTLNFVETK